MIEDTVKERLKREVVGILLIAVALFLFLSLLSYHPADPSFFTYTIKRTKEIGNWMGIVGAYGSALLFQGFGFPAFLIPFILGLIAIGYILRWEWRYPLIKLAGWAILLVVTSSLFSLWMKPLRIPPQDFLVGGILGEVLSRSLSRYLNLPGATLLLGAVWVLGFVLGTGVSFIGVVRHLGRGLARVADQIRTIKMVKRGQNERAQKRLKRKQEKKERPREGGQDESELRTEEPPPVVVVDRTLPSKRRAEIAEQTCFDFGEDRREFQLPPISLLEVETERKQRIDRESLVMNSRILEKKLLDYGVEGRVVEVRPGPVITVYEFEPAPGVKVSRIVNLADDLALALSAVTIRIVAPIPGKSVVGIEVPNAIRETVYLREIVDSDPFRNSKSKLTIGIGKDISGEPFVFDLAKMPHLLVAGSTGSGKSVSINAMINSILFKATPEEVRFIMIDPKMLELSDYDGIPHLLLPVVTNPKKAAVALKWLVEEMERRYTILAERSVRNIDHYHQKIEKGLKERRRAPKQEGEAPGQEGRKEEERIEPLPYIVVVIDELADLMMVSSKEVEESITRLAQMARAVGIHLILATQRPSVDVLTGLIKANFPARISFQVTSKVDSRTILDTVGAEHLLGSGDMLFLPPGSAKLIRIHGAYISSGEIKRVVEFLKEQEAPRYETSILTETKKDQEVSGGEDEYDEKYDEAVAFVAETGQASISLIQRRFRIGYNRAARIIEKMEQEGVVGPSDGVKPREVYIKKIEP